jgi:TonB-dependent starch-binding outer membrane protein SusC
MFNFNCKNMKKKPLPDLSGIRWIFSKHLLAMKLSILLCFVGIMNVSAGLFSQNANVTLAMKNKTVKEVLREVESNSRYRFLYNADFLDLDRIVSIHAENNTVVNVLNELFASADVSYHILDNNLVVLTPAREVQVHRITGTIRDALTGETLPGVSILVEGTTIGAVTDAFGRYTLEAPDGNVVLVVAYLGYLRERIEVAGRTVIDVALAADLKALDEVLVVGYGSMKRSDITGSVVSISEEKLRTTVTTSLDQALQGRAAGVQVFQNSGQPGGGVSIRIRGANSISNTSEPLYVIDGLPVDAASSGTALGFDWAGGGNGQTAVSALATINPADIVSVEILKDASAAAIYGARGANGVVLITTRRGKKGESNVTYEPYFGLQQINKKLDIMTLPEFAAYHTELAQEGWISEREDFLDPSLLGPGTDWQDEVFRLAPITNHQLRVTGGTERTAYAISGGYFKQDGIVTGSNFDRYSFRVNLDNEAKRWLKIGNTLSFSRTQEKITLNDSEDGIIAATLLQSPATPVKFMDGSWGGPLDTQFGVDNPLAVADHKNLSLLRSHLFGNIYGEAKLHPTLTFRSEFGTNILFRNNYGFLSNYNYGRIRNDITNSRRSYSQDFSWEIKNYLTWEPTIADAHRINLLLGQEASEANWEGLTGSRTNFLSNTVQELDAGDAETATNGGYKGSSSMMSYFSRINYVAFDKYLLTATFRADGSSKFGPDNRWGFFQSYALAWRISEEDFLKDSEVISNLRLRASYGEVGNQNIGNYRYGSALSSAPSGIGQTFRLQNIPNPRLKWEASQSTNLGFELGLFEQRIDLMVDVYRKYTNDMLLILPLPAYLGGGDWMGIESPWVNIGELENQGVELTLTTRNIAQPNFSWNTDLTFTHNKNKVLSMGEEDFIIYRNVQWFNPVTKTMAGHPLGQFYGYVVEGIFESAEDIANHAKQHDQIHPTTGVWIGDLKFKDLNNDGIINADDRTFIGDPNPLFTFGLNNQFNFGQFDLSVYLQGSYGNDIYNYTRRQTEALNTGNFNQLATVTQRANVVMIDPQGSTTDPANFMITNPGTAMPRSTTTDPNDNRRISDRYVEDGSYLRIQNVSLGYVLPSRFGAGAGLTRLRIYMGIQNLHTFTNYSGYDPEVGAYNQDALLTGVDNGRYPLARIYTMGLTATF